LFFIYLTTNFWGAIILANLGISTRLQSGVSTLNFGDILGRAVMLIIFPGIAVLNKKVVATWTGTRNSFHSWRNPSFKTCRPYPACPTHPIAIW